MSNIPKDIEIPFQCYPFNENDMYNEEPDIYTHILIPKQINSNLFYPKIPIDISLDLIENETVKNILLTLEYEGIRKIQNKKILEDFCVKRTLQAFSNIEISNLKYTINNEDEIKLEKKCYFCLKNFIINDKIFTHPIYNDIIIHYDCLCNVF